MRMRPRLDCLLTGILGATLCSVLPAFSARAAEKIKKVLVVGIDGCRPDALQKAKATNLAALAQSGAFSYTAQNLPLRLVDAETSSGPSWASLLSGVFPDKHGWLDDVRRKRFNGQYPHFFARLKTHDPNLSTASIITWPDLQRITTGAEINEFVKKDQAAVERGIELLTKQNPDALFIHLDSVDAAGHGKGFSPDVPEYLAAIEEMDLRVGQIVAAVRARPDHARENWLILVSTDHGGAGGGHNSHQNVVPEIRKIFYIASGDSTEPGEIKGQVYGVDVAATALAHLGVKLDPAWKLDGVPAGLKAFPPPAVSRPAEPAATVLIRRPK